MRYAVIRPLVVIVAVCALTVGCSDDSSSGWIFQSGADDTGAPSDTRSDTQFDADTSDADDADSGKMDAGQDELPPCWRNVQPIDPLDAETCPQPRGPDDDGDGLSNSR